MPLGAPFQIRKYTLYQGTPGVTCTPDSSVGFFLRLSATENYSSQAVQRTSNTVGCVGEHSTIAHILRDHLAHRLRAVGVAPPLARAPPLLRE